MGGGWGSNFRPDAGETQALSGHSSTGPASNKAFSGAFAVVNSLEDFEIENNETPELDNLVVHVFLFFFADFHGHDQKTSI